MLFQACRDYNLTLNFAKAKICRREIKFLGYILTTKGLKADPKKIHKIQEFPAPRNIKQLRGFLGLINFYARFSHELAAETIPLLELLRKDVKWKWETQHQEAFERVKMLFINTVVLKHPLPNVPYQLLTDSSDYALDAILTQVDEDDNQKIVACASRKLKGPEINYFTSEKEMLAIIWSVKKFKTYLFGAKTTIKTDHRALTFLKICKFPRLYYIFYFSIFQYSRFD